MHFDLLALTKRHKILEDFFLLAGLRISIISYISRFIIIKVSIIFLITSHKCMKYGEIRNLIDTFMCTNISQVIYFQSTVESTCFQLIDSLFYYDRKD